MHFRNRVEGIIHDYYQDSRTEECKRYTPECTRDALVHLQEALADVRGNPVALACLDAAQDQLAGEAWAEAARRVQHDLADVVPAAGGCCDGSIWGKLDPQRGRTVSKLLSYLAGRFGPLKMCAPPDESNDTVDVQAHELPGFLHRIVAAAADRQALAVRRGRRQQLALRRMVRELAYVYEAESGNQATAGSDRGVRSAASGRTGRATRLAGGAFRRFLGVVFRYSAALYGEPAPTVGTRLIRSVLAEHHAEPRWGLSWVTQIG
jgi:hypothetical protein